MRCKVSSCIPVDGGPLTTDRLEAGWTVVFDCEEEIVSPSRLELGAEQEHEEHMGPRCEATLWGSPCAYYLGHDGRHWTLSDDWGEASWTEESERRRRAAYDRAKLELESLAAALDAEQETAEAETVRTMLAELAELFPMYAAAK